ncbi:MAG: hypothetical protein C3F02_00930 [Parcubacteria group bacterium]|nr:MAG: hypothetical protein C3F02_00930 [Parcubacteria group bacterium]
MRYLVLLIIYLLAAYFFLLLNMFGSHWHYIQPILVASLLVYFNTTNHWVRYVFALLSGLFIDVLSPIFGLQSFVFITIIFILSILQFTVFSSRNMFSVIVLTTLAFVIFWFLFYLLNFIFSWSFYDLSQLDVTHWLWGTLINILAVSFFHLLHYNLWAKKHEKQSF